MESSDKKFWIFAACVIVALLGIGLINLYEAKTSGPSIKPISYSQFLDDVDKGDVRWVNIAGHEITGGLGNRSYFKTYSAEDPDLIKRLRDNRVVINAEAGANEGTSSWTGILTALLPTLLFIGVLIFFWNRMPGMGGGGRIMGLGKSKAKMLGDAYRVTFADVAGVDEAKDDLQEIVDFLRDPHKFKRLGGRIPKGVLLVGPPGTGKTLLARAIAGEANVPFFTISGSDFVEMFVGVGASRVRDMFEQAKKSAPCIIFMDEIDAVGRKRGAGLGGGNDEREQTLNQLLVEMDGFTANEGVILIAATNRPDVLDPALLRPGRFDREIVVSIPDILGRENILRVHVRHVPLSPDVDLKSIARRTPGFSGADLMNLVNEAALLAVRRERQVVTMREFDDAKDRVVMGVERRTFVMSDTERRVTAYRESGRAIVALHVPASDPVHKLTIIPRGRSMGTMKQLPEADQLSLTREQMTSRLSILLGGYAAEEMIFGPEQVTAGSANDLEQATKLARNMVTRFGFSDRLGTVTYGENQEEVFLGNSVTRQQNVSEETAKTIDIEIRKIIDAALGEAKRILTIHRDQLETLAQDLLHYETLSGDEVRDLLSGKKPQREPENEPAPEAVTGA